MSFTGSEYGLAIPIVFGSDKVPGNVIWASPTKIKSVQSDGALIFYQTLNFAVAFAEGPIDSVLRIWLGERLIYSTVMEVDENGVPIPDPDGFVNGYTIDVIDPDSPLAGVKGVSDVTQLSVFYGDEEQIPYGVMADEEGYLLTPAYRGTAYLMFENFVVTSSEMPNIYIEVSANSSSSFPRAQSLIPNLGDFDAFDTDTLLINPALQAVYYGANDGLGGHEGWIQANSGSLEAVQEIEIVSETIGVLGNIREWGYSLLLPSGKLFTLVNKSGSGSYGIIVDPNIGYVTDIYGPSNGPTFEGGVAGQLSDVHEFQFLNSDLEPTDYIAAVDLAGDLGILQVTPRGEMGTRNDSITSGIPTQCILGFIEFTPEHYAEVPQFADNDDPALGGFLFYVGDTSLVSTSTFTMGRVYLGTNMPDSATLTPIDMMTLDLDSMSGQGVQHHIVDIVPDADAKLVLFIVASDSTDWMVKWDPRRNVIDWTAPVVLSGQLTGDFRKHARARMNAVRYSWIYNNTIYTIDLQTGNVETTVTNVFTEQALPRNFGKSRQFYDAFEDSLIYFSAGAINKVWIGRTGTVTSSLQTVVRKLLERVGVSPADINVSDFAVQTLRGYSINAVQPIRNALADLRKAFTYEVVESNGRYQYISRGSSAAATIPNERLADVSGGGGFLPRTIENDITQLRKVNLTYKDINREYRQNVQSVYIPQTKNLGFDSDAALSVTIPVALNAAEAKTIADIILYAKRVGEESFNFTTGFRYAYLDPGDVVSITISATESALIRITNMRFSDDYRIEFEGVLEDPDIYNDDAGLSGSAGRFNFSEFKRPDPILTPYIMQIPCRDPSEFDTESTDFGNCYYTVLNLQRGQSSPSRFPMQIQYDTGELTTTQTPATFPTWGLLTQNMDDISNPATPQGQVSIVIKVFNQKTGFGLASVANMAALIDSSGGYKNLAMLGNELIQFVTATDLGGGLWRLTGLLRGRFGTETFVNNRAAGEKFILITNNTGTIDNGSIMKKELPIVESRGTMKGTLSIITNNPDQPKTYGNWDHFSKRPFDVSNVEITFDTSPDAYTLSWDKRSRAVYDYADDGVEDADFVVDEEVLEFEIVLADTDTGVSSIDASTYLRKVRVNTTTYTYSLADQTADGFDFTTDTLYVWVYQISSSIDDGLRLPRVFSIGPQI
jgi:hypothetical protein